MIFDDAPSNEVLFGRIAVRLGFISQEQLNCAIEAQQTTMGNSKIGEILISKGFLNEVQLLLVLSRQNGIEIVDLDNIQIPAEIIAKFNSSIAMLVCAIPIGSENGHLAIAISHDSYMIVNLDALKRLLEDEALVFKFAVKEQIVKKILENYPDAADPYSNFPLPDLTEPSTIETPAEAVTLESLNARVQELEQRVAQLESRTLSLTTFD